MTMGLTDSSWGEALMVFFVLLGAIAYVVRQDFRLNQTIRLLSQHIDSTDERFAKKQEHLQQILTSVAVSGSELANLARRVEALEHRDARPRND